MVEGPRISVIGVSGSGKSTIARLAAARLRIPYIELDAIHHGPKWTEIPDEDFRRIVRELVAGDAWVIDGGYRAVRDLVWARATTVVWVDPPKATVMAQVIWRSFIRALTRHELWHGNWEEFRTWVDPGASDPLGMADLYKAMSGIHGTHRPALGSRPVEERGAEVARLA